MYIQETYSIGTGFSLFYAKFDFDGAYGKGCKEGINKIDSTKQAFYPAASSATESNSFAFLKLNVL
ncbi:MAG TPA: hypothetical protein DEO71_14375 [Chryseobacterium sp.]|nr:hypothetical protein [Chryseobacterium sp.]